MKMHDITSKINILNSKMYNALDNISDEFKKDDIKVESYTDIVDGITKLRKNYFKKGDIIQSSNITINYGEDYIGSKFKICGNNKTYFNKYGFCEVNVIKNSVIIKGYDFDGKEKWVNNISEKIDVRGFIDCIVTRFDDYDFTFSIQPDESYYDYVFHRVCLDGKTGEIKSKLLSAHIRTCNKNDCSAFPGNTLCICSKYMEISNNIYSYNSKTWEHANVKNILELDNNYIYILTDDGFYRSTASDFTPKKFEFPESYTINKGIDKKYPDTINTGNSRESCKRTPGIAGYVTVTKKYVFIYNGSETIYKYNKDGTLYAKFDINNFSKNSSGPTHRKCEVVYINEDYILTSNGKIYNQNGYEMKDISSNINIQFSQISGVYYNDSYMIDDTLLMIIYHGDIGGDVSITFYNIFDIKLMKFLYDKCILLLNSYDCHFISKNLVKSENNIYELLAKPNSILIK